MSPRLPISSASGAGAPISSAPWGRSSPTANTWNAKSLWGTTGLLWRYWNASHLSRANLILIGLSLLLWTGTRDAWTESRVTVAQLQAAQWRMETAARLAPEVRRLRDIAVLGIRTEDDLEWARTACAIVAADICLTQGVDNGIHN